jgi:hypothetical protein
MLFAMFSFSSLFAPSVARVEWWSKRRAVVRSAATSRRGVEVRALGSSDT